ncbi:hypothetical protein OFB84_33005, partial [Escherichia coli]|nr:hypothetical protein [Escherichia coli]
LHVIHKVPAKQSLKLLSNLLALSVAPGCQQVQDAVLVGAQAFHGLPKNFGISPAVESREVSHGASESHDAVGQE